MVSARKSILSAVEEEGSIGVPSGNSGKRFLKLCRELHTVRAKSIVSTARPCGQSIAAVP
jgi:hypothetical protein